MVVVDAGNTSTAVGVWTCGRVTRVTHCDGGFAEAEPIVRRLATGSDAMAYVSVVPSVDARWKRLASALALPFRQVSCIPFVRPSSRPLGIRLDYPHPETIGADRLADAVGAVDRYGAPVIVCDFGTAFTAAVVTADKVWRGGAIAPGLPLMRDYLCERTAKLPRLKLGGRCPKIGRSTEGAMRFGTLVGYRGMVREIVSRLSVVWSGRFRLVATGGFAKWALDGSGMDFTIDPTLTLHGAGLLASLVA